MMNLLIILYITSIFLLLQFIKSVNKTVFMLIHEIESVSLSIVLWIIVSGLISSFKHLSVFSPSRTLILISASSLINC